MPPHPEQRLSDLVRDSKIETEVQGACIQHIFYESGLSARERHIRKEERWAREKCLGQGAYGTVYLEKCVQGATQRFRAVKKVKKFLGDGQDLEYLRELEAVVKFSHRKYSHCFVRSDGWFEIGNSIYIAMEYLSMGDLQRYLTRPLPESEARQITTQVLEGLGFMHENGFVHRDVKPGNIMVVTAGPDWFVKIADFGISKRRQQDITSLRTMQRGTLGFAAPESFGFNPDNTTTSYTYSVDIWSLGAMAYRILTETLPFQNISDMFKYVHGTLSFPSSLLEKHDVSEQGQDFILKLMSSNPQHRPTAARAMEHEWCSSRFDMASADIQPSNFETKQSLGISTESTWASTASKAWSDEATNTITHLEDMGPELNMTSHHPRESFVEDIAKNTLEGSQGEPMVAMILSEKTAIKPSPATYQPPFIEDCQDESDIGREKYLPADWPFVLQLSTDNYSQEDPHPPSSVPAILPQKQCLQTPALDLPSTDRVIIAEPSSDKNDGVLEESLAIICRSDDAPASTQRAPSQDSYPPHRSRFVDIEHKAEKIRSPDEFQSSSRDHQSATRAIESHVTLQHLTSGAPISFDTNSSSETMVELETAIVYCNSCDFAYAFPYGPYEYLPCKHYMCHTCLLQLLALSLLSPKYMPPRCCDHALGEIGISNFTRIIIDAKTKNILNAWDDLKIVKELGWICSRRHLPRNGSLLVTNASVPVWKQPVNCSKCVTVTYVPVAKDLEYPGYPGYRYDEHCLFCGEKLQRSGHCQCGSNQAIDKFIELLYTSGALETKTTTSDRIHMAVRTRYDMANGKTFSYRAWDNMEIEKELEYSRSPTPEPPGVETPLPRCYACKTPVTEQFGEEYDQNCQWCGAYLCSLCGTKWGQCSCLESSYESHNIMKVPYQGDYPIITQDRESPDERYNFGARLDDDDLALNNRSPSVGTHRLGRMPRQYFYPSPNVRHPRSKSSCSNGRTVSENSGLLGSGSNGYSEYEDILPSRPNRRSAYSLEPNSAQNRLGTTTYYGNSPLERPKPKIIIHRVEPQPSSRYVETPFEVGKAKNHSTRKVPYYPAYE